MVVLVSQRDNNKHYTAKAVLSDVIQFDAVVKIEAMCFDTTSVNTGRLREAYVLLEQLFEKDKHL